MIRISRKRSATLWRIALLLLGFLKSSELVSSAPADPGESTRRPSLSLTPLESFKSRDIGSPAQLAWQDWILENPQPGPNSGISSAKTHRRITPKSVFVAPHFPKCAEGYEEDKMKRCNKIVTLDQNRQNSFLQDRLNLLFRGNVTSNQTQNTNTKPQSPAPNGPFQLNIPLFLGASKVDPSPQVGKTEPPSTVIPLETKKEEPVYDYEADNSKVTYSHVEQERPPLISTNFTVHQKNDQGSSSPAFEDPIADFNDEANKTVPEIVVYKIPLGLPNITNHTLDSGNRSEDDMRRVDKPTADGSWKQEESWTTNHFPISEDDSTTLYSREDEESYESTTTTRDTATDNDVTEKPTRKEITSDGLSDIDSEMETWSNESDASPIHDTEKYETTTIVPDVVYEEEFEPDLEDQDEYTYTTAVSEEDPGEYDDEILKHGETGMPIPADNQALIQSKKQKTHTPKDGNPTETTTFSPTESDSITTTEGGEDLGSNVSSEVRINKDFVLEKTLLGVNTGKVKNSTKPVSANSTASQQSRVDDLKALFEAEKKLITEPEVVFSPQDNRGSGVYGRKRDEQHVKTNFQSIKESHDFTTTEPPAVSKPLPHPARLRDPQTRPTQQQVSFHSDNIAPPDTKPKFPFRSPDLDLKFPYFGNEPIPPTNRRGNQDFVRFPTYERPNPGFVRFPSDDVNTIHSPKTKNSFSSDYKPQTNWWIPPTVKRQPQKQGASAKPQDFWGKIPLQRDLSLEHWYSTPALDKEAVSRSSRVSPSRRRTSLDVFQNRANPV